MTWLARRFGTWASGVQRQEMEQFIANLSASDASEVAGVCISAANFRHGMLVTGDDPLDPIICVSKNPTVAIGVVSMIKKVQKLGRPDAAVGGMVWLHTLRAAQYPELRQLGRDLWRQLGRGFPHVPTVAQDFDDLGLRYKSDRAAEYPIGFTPDPL